MPPKGSTRKAAALKLAAANRVASSKEKTAAVKETAATRSKSPVKDAAVTKPSPVKKSPAKKSPAKKTTSPGKKPASPEKPVTYKTTMTRDTRASSTAPKAARDAFQKRGLLGTNDNDDDPTQPTEEMVAAFDERYLTKVDKMLIDFIRTMEERDTATMINPAIAFVEVENDAEADGQPLDCHTKIYWRFLDLWARRNDGRYPQDTWGRNRAATPSSPARRPTRTATRSTSKAPSPSKGGVARRVSSNSGRSPERRQFSMSRPMRPESAKSSEYYGGLVSDKAAGSSKVSKGYPAVYDRGFRTRTATSADIAERYRLEQTRDYLDSFERDAYAAMMADREMSPLPTNLKAPKAAIYTAQERGRARAMLELEDDHDVDMTYSSDEEPAPAPDIEIIKQRDAGRSRSPAKQRAGSGGQSPAKQRAGSRAQSPEKPHPHTGRHSPGKQPATRKSSVTAPRSAYPNEPGRGVFVSNQNPKMIEVTADNGKKAEQENSFHETMPAPEVWHRRMPPVFPFGETPYMARIVSDQINADLSRSE